MCGSVDIQRDRIYIVKDLILKLVEYGELNQTTLVTFCRLNLKKHRPILYDLELNELIIRNKKQFGKRMVTVYKPTQKGIEFCRNTLDPYEKMFPRRKGNIDIIENEEKANDKPSGVDETHLLRIFIMSRSAKEWSSPQNALAYLNVADNLPHRSEAESVLIDHLPENTKRVLDLGTGALLTYGNLYS